MQLKNVISGKRFITYVIDAIAIHLDSSNLSYYNDSKTIQNKLKRLYIKALSACDNNKFMVQFKLLVSYLLELFKCLYSKFVRI